MSAIVSKIFQRIHCLLLTSRIQRLEFDRVLQSLLSNAQPNSHHQQILKDHYLFYVSHISSPQMASSLELISILDIICRNSQYKKLLDLGSGFSSFVFRYYAKTDPMIQVWSIDDDPQWIDKTKRYLMDHHVKTDNLMMLHDFIAGTEANFDLIFLDLNFVDVRKHYISLAVERCKKGGMIVFDDVHKPEFMYEVLKQTRAIPLKLYDLKPLAIDQFGRYALLGVKG